MSRVQARLVPRRLAQSSLPYMYVVGVFSTLLWRDSYATVNGVGVEGTAEVTTATQFGLICGFFGVSFF